MMRSATIPYQKKHQKVLGQEMAYVEVGNGDPIVFPRGNSTFVRGLHYLQEDAPHEIGQTITA